MNVKYMKLLRDARTKIDTTIGVVSKSVVLLFHKSQQQTVDCWGAFPTFCSHKLLTLESNRRNLPRVSPLFHDLGALLRKNTCCQSAGSQDYSWGITPHIKCPLNVDYMSFVGRRPNTDSNCFGGLGPYQKKVCSLMNASSTQNKQTQLHTDFQIHTKASLSSAQHNRFTGTMFQVRTRPKRRKSTVSAYHHANDTPNSLQCERGKVGADLGTDTKLQRTSDS